MDKKSNKYKMSYYIDKNNCAPCQLKKTQGNNKRFMSCYSKESLVKIANSWNNQKDNIKINIGNLTREKLWYEIQKKLEMQCKKDEVCWKKQDFIKKLKDSEIDMYTFKPEYPEEWKKNKYSWLSTYDIYYVMKQYEKMYDDVYISSPIPSDCPIDIQCELSKFDVMSMKKNKIFKIGIIYNLDKSTQSGSHWIAIYIDNKNNEINYYDSTASLPVPLINKFIIKVVNQYRKHNIEPTVIYNDKRHQWKNSECGVYSMNFILERINGKTMYDLTKVKIPDENMNYLRNLLYQR
jgi:hypothetical protein